MATEITTKPTGSTISTNPVNKAGGLTFHDYVQIVAGAKELPDSDVDMAAIMAQIMGAESLDAGLGERKAEGLRAHVGEVILVHDFHVNRSDEKFGAGSPVYAAIDATTSDGERLILTTGAGKVLGALGLILKLGQWDEAYRVGTYPTPNGDGLELVYLPRVGEGSEAF